MPELVNLVQLGFHGTALAFLVLGYRLLKHTLDDPPAEDPENKKLALILRNIRFFLAASLVFLIVGVAAQYAFDQAAANRADRAVEVHLSPTGSLPDGVDGPIVSTKIGRVIFQDGRGDLVVAGQNDSIRVIFDHIVARLHLLEAEIRAHESVLAAELEGGGFDDDFGLRSVPKVAPGISQDRFQPEIPGEAVDRIQKARKLTSERRFEEALEILQEVVEQHPDYYRGHYNLGLTLARAGRPEEALEALAETSRIREEAGITDTTLLASVGWTHYLAGNYLKAQESLEAALEQEGLSPSSRQKIQNNLGTVLKRLGEFEQARAVLEQSAVSGSARARANLKVIEVTRQMEQQLRQTHPLVFEVKPEPAESREGGESGGGG